MNMPVIFISLGTLLIFSLFLENIGHKISLPRVSLLLLFGFIIGPGVFNVLPEPVHPVFPILTNIALAMIGFLIGGKLTRSTLQSHGIYAVIISISLAVTTMFVVGIGLYFIGLPLTDSVILGVIAAATAPATTIDVIHELKENTLFSQMLLEIVAISEIFVLFLFSFAFVIVDSLLGTENISHFLISAFWNIFAAVFIGLFIGLPSSLLITQIKTAEAFMVGALGIVLLASGLAHYFNCSFLIASMTLGAIVTNFSHEDQKPFEAIEHIDAPFLIVFFILAGASLHFDDISQFILFTLCYIVLRVFSLLLGGYFSARLLSSKLKIKPLFGIALMPQAGVVLGMALIASQHFPQLSAIILPTTLTATVVFEIFGPLMTRYALIKARDGENTA